MKTQLLLFFALFYFTFDCYTQWSSDFRITNNDNFSSLWPNAFFSGTNIYVTWEDARDGNVDIYFKSSTDNGLSWGADYKISNTSYLSYDPVIVSSGSVVHLIWRENTQYSTQVQYIRSTDNGLSWGNMIVFSEGGQPTISVNGSLVIAAWGKSQNNNTNIFYNRSTNNGFSWEQNIRLTVDTSRAGNPCSFISGDTVHIVWSDYRSSNSEIYYIQSTNSGVSWRNEIRLTNNLSESTRPDLEVLNGRVHVFWRDSPTPTAMEQVFYKQSTDGGNNWGSNSQLTTGFVGTEIDAASRFSNLHIIWTDSRNPPNYEIFYKHSTDNGITWGADTRLTNDPANSWAGSVGVSDSIVHVIWGDMRNGTGEIYHKMNLTGNPNGIIQINPEIPKIYNLTQNYPNPFNPVTKIRFQLPKNGFVSMEIYDALGRNLTTLVNEDLNPGVYEVEWNAASQPSGIYFYRITASEFSEVKKMVLVK